MLLSRRRPDYQVDIELRGERARGEDQLCDKVAAVALCMEGPFH